MMIKKQPRLIPIFMWIIFTFSEMISVITLHEDKNILVQLSILFDNFLSSVISVMLSQSVLVFS